jgi:eukaryotic-like serine/threonine-protein kinase
VSDPVASAAVRACPECLAVYEDGFASCARDGKKLVVFEIDPLIGHELERYRIEALIGTGAMGRVYRARHLRMTRQFALKLMYGNLAADERMRARFTREAEAASRLNHPNLITVFDVGETAGGVPYLAMDLIEGKGLDEILRDQAPLDPDRVVELSRGILRGLLHAHSRNLIHRDLKPSNVLVVREHGEEVPKLVDFGLALVPDATVGRVTTGSLVFGTPEYMSPEQATAQPDLDLRSDLFSLGTIMYEMLSGFLPHDGQPLEIMQKNVSSPAPSIVERTGLSVPPDLEAIVHRLLAKRREERYPSALAALEALDEVAGARRPAALDDSGGALASGATPGESTANQAAGSRDAPADEARARPMSAPFDSGRTLSMEPGGKRRWIATAAVLLATAAALAAWTVHRRERERVRSAAAAGPPAAAVGDAGPTAATPLDAGAASAHLDDTPGVIDAAPLAGGPVDAGPVVAVTPPDRPVKPRPDGRRPDAGPVKNQAEPTAEVLVARFKKLGQWIDALARRDAAVAAPLRQRYFAIPVADAMRRPEMRREVAAAIAALDRAVAAAE